MTKMAKCGIHKYSFCTHKHDAPECENCLLIHRRPNLYIWINGKKHKRCPHCNQYKPLSEFKTNSNGNISWCINCHREYARDRYKMDNKDFMVAHRVGEKKVHVKFNSTHLLIKFIRECIENGEKLIEIKRI